MPRSSKKCACSKRRPRKGRNAKRTRKPYTKPSGLSAGGFGRFGIGQVAYPAVEGPRYRPRRTKPGGLSAGGFGRFGIGQVAYPAVEGPKYRPRRTKPGGLSAGGRLDREIANLGKQFMSPQYRSMGKFFKDVGRAVARTDNYKRRMGK